ncbi:MMPL family transporter [Actinomadura sp. 9N215]|uniref:MMPL family transporter n=1 Tax=Actinomadura sp. 9N215 TaxID=3375150 RepID=UPI0037B78278
MGQFLARCGMAAARRRRTTIAGWSLILVLAAVILPGLLSAPAPSSVGVSGSESARVERTVGERIPMLGNDQALLVLRSAGLPRTDPEYRRVLSATTRSLARRHGVASVFTLPPPGQNLFQISFPYRDPRNGYAFVTLHGTDRELMERLPAQRAAVERAARAASDGQISAYLVGRTSFYHDLREKELAELKVIEAVALILALAVLALGLGTLGAAIVTLLTAGATLLATFGVFAMASSIFLFDGFLLMFVSLIGLAIGTDYALLIVSRYREELRNGGDRMAAAGVAVTTAGKTVYVSGGVVGVLATTQFLVRVPAYHEFALTVIVVVVVAMAASITLLPALLVVATPVLDKGRMPGYRRASGAAMGEAGGWARWARHLMRHPWPYIVIITLVLLACAAPALGLRTGADFQRAAITGTPSGRALEILERDSFAGASGYVIVVTGPAAARPALTALRADSQVAAAMYVTYQDHTAVLAVPRTAIDSARTADLVRRIRADIVPKLGSPALVGGPTAVLVDFHAEFAAKLPWVVTVVIIGALLLLGIALRSVLLAIKTVVLSLVTVVATYGVLVMVFQWGRDGYVQPYLPLAMFVILFALSLDYQMFLVRRVQEIYLATGDNTQAVAAALQRTARPILLAALIMIVVASGTLLSGISEIRQFGLGVAIAIAIEATLVRLALTPALMQVLGHWNWWPGHRPPSSPGAVRRRASAAPRTAGRGLCGSHKQRR